MYLSRPIPALLKADTRDEKGRKKQQCVCKIVFEFHNALIINSYCGEEGIRTPGTLTRTPVFEAGSFNHSDTSPLGLQIYD